MKMYNIKPNSYSIGLTKEKFQVRPKKNSKFDQKYFFANATNFVTGPELMSHT